MKNFISKLALTLCVASTLAMCANKPSDKKGKLEYTPLNFPKTENVKVTLIKGDYAIAGGSNLRMVGDKIILRAANTDNKHHIQVFDTKSNKFVASFGTSGRGEGELVGYTEYDVNIEKNEFYAEWQNKYVIYDLAKVISGQTGYLKEQGFHKNINTTDDIFYLGNDRILHLGAHPRFIITSKNLQDTLGRYDERHYISKFFANHKDPDLQRRYIGNNGIFTLKPDGSKFVNSFYSGFYMQIFDIKNNTITAGEECRFVEARMKDELAAMSDCITGPYCMDSTDDYIYIMYSEGFDFDFSEPRLGVFDWKGKEVKNYILDMMAYSFVMTPDGKRCYCMVQDDEGECWVGYFDLK